MPLESPLYTRIDMRHDKSVRIKHPWDFAATVPHEGNSLVKARRLSIKNT